jgi:hypothetical protein
MLFSLKYDMNEVRIDLVVASTLLLLEEPFRWEHSRQSLLYLFCITRFLPAKVQFRTYLMNLMIVFSNGPKVLESKMGPIM